MRTYSNQLQTGLRVEQYRSGHQYTSQCHPRGFPFTDPCQLPKYSHHSADSWKDVSINSFIWKPYRNGVVLTQFYSYQWRKETGTEDTHRCRLPAGSPRASFESWISHSERGGNLQFKTMKVKRCNVKIELELTIFSIYNKTKLLKAIFYLKIDSQFLTSDPNTNDVDVFFAVWIRFRSHTTVLPNILNC